MYQFRIQPENFEYVKDIMYKFQISPFIANLCEDEYDVGQVLARDPRTLLVHSKFPFLSERDQFIRRSFIRVLGRYSLDSHRAKYKDAKAWPPTAVLHDLCTSGERRTYLQTLRKQLPPGE